MEFTDWLFLKYFLSRLLHRVIPGRHVPIDTLDVYIVVHLFTTLYIVDPDDRYNQRRHTDVQMKNVCMNTFLQKKNQKNHQNVKYNILLCVPRKMRT